MVDRAIVWLDRKVGNTAGVIGVLFAALVVGFVASVVLTNMVRPPTFTFPDTPVASSPATVADPDPLLPSAVSVPAINAESTLVPVGLQPGGALDVPPEDQPQQAAWFTGAPAPGQDGPAVVVGHVNGGGEPGVFVDLDELIPGDLVSVDLTDGSALVFEVYAVERHPKADFPTERVYGDTSGPELRLITCGGAFDPDADSYTDNVIVWAAQVP